MTLEERTHAARFPLTTQGARRQRSITDRCHQLCPLAGVAQGE